MFWEAKFRDREMKHGEIGRKNAGKVGKLAKRDKKHERFLKK